MSPDLTTEERGALAAMAKSSAGFANGGPDVHHQIEILAGILKKTIAALERADDYEMEQNERR